MESSKTKQPAVGLLSQLFLARKADMQAENFLQNFLPAFQQKMRLRAALDFSRLDTNELTQLLASWHEEFIKEIYVEAEVMTTVASLYVLSAKNALEKRGLSATSYLRPDQILPDMRALQMRIAVQNGSTSLAEYLTEFGHRAAYDFELSEPRAHEQTATLLPQISQLPGSLPTILPAPTLAAGMLTKTAARARRYLHLKEQAKHECLRALDQMRRLMLELDQRWQMQGAIFDLSFAAIFNLSTPLTSKQLEELRLKKLQKQVFQNIKLDPVTSITSLEKMDFHSNDKPVSSQAIVTHLSGIRVAGHGEVSGRALVLQHLSDQVQLLAGQILVIANANPAWVPLFPTATGVICETGGWLCHAAIMAREFDLPAIFSVSAAMSSIKTGDELILHEDGRISINVS
jgi:phosphohistidine swiveling domain-containing protein